MAPALLVSALLSLAACGGGGDDSGSGGQGTSPPSGNATSTNSATLSWLPPTENMDGTSVSNLVGYRIYTGPSAASLAPVRTIGNPGITTAVVDGLAKGTHYFAVSAFTSSGSESDPSSIGSKTVR